MIKPTHVEPRGERRIWLRYSDGSEGEVDLAGLTGKGVFRVWDEPGTFDRIHLAPHGAIAWNADIELCPDALYMEVTGKLADDVLTGLRRHVTSA